MKSIRSLGSWLSGRLSVAAMLTILSAMASLVSFRFQGRVSLELEVLALRHQLAPTGCDSRRTNLRVLKDSSNPNSAYSG
jgi:hypothetical protein